MRYSKPVLTVMVVLMILSLNFTTVGAQGEPTSQDRGEPVGEPDLSGYTELTENYVPEGVPVTIDAAAPLSPIGNYVYTRTPTFYFARQEGATKYKIMVRSYQTEYIEVYEGLATCPSYYCYMKLPKKLIVRYSRNSSSDAGRYDWCVSAYTTSWQTPTNWTEPDFYVLSKGFNNDFSIDPSKWWASAGLWSWNELKGRIDTNGTNIHESSVYHQEAFINFDYSVKMKRLVNTNNTNSIIVWGNPFPIDTVGRFNDGIYFSYANSGDWLIYKNVDGVLTVIQTWTHNPAAINEHGSNTLRVRAVYPYLDLWINGVYLGWIKDFSLKPQDLTANTVGFGAAKVTPTEPLRVTSAVLTVIDVSALTVHDPAMQLGLNPIEGVDPEEFLWQR